MYNDQPAKSVKFKSITIEGFSRAAVQTYWRVPEMKLGFDLGAQPWSFMGTPTWFVSHAHMDHLLALPAYVARRRMMKMEPPTIYLPEDAVHDVQQILRHFQRLDRGRLPCKLIGLKPGQEITLSRELAVTVSKTRHTVPSLGFVVWERRKKLKPEYEGLTPDEYRALSHKGIELSAETRIPRVAYLGDSSPEGLDECPAMYEAQVLICELTFVSPSHRREKIHKHGHLHLDDLLARRDKFKNELVIASHFSTRYHEKQIVHWVKKAIPDMMDDRLMLWL